MKKKGHLRISLKYATFDKQILGEILKVGVPIFLFQLLFGISKGMTNTAAREFGDHTIAAVGIVIRVLAIGTFVVFGFVKGFQPLAGYAYGAKNNERLKESIKTSLKWTSIFCIVFAALMMLFTNNVMSWFSNDPLVIQIGHKMLFANGLIFMFFGFQVVYSTLFLALGKGKEGVILSIARNGIFFIPVILILPHLWGLNGVIYAQVVADILTVLLTGVFVVKLNKEIKIKQ
jgi:Na+-driven multidrug efflux pump